MKIDDFGGLCLTNAHLAFRPKGFSRRFAPQNDNGYAFTLLHMCILPHLRITTLPLWQLPQYHITTSGIVMPMNNEWPLINVGKAQEPMDS